MPSWVAEGRRTWRERRRFSSGPPERRGRRRPSVPGSRPRRPEPPSAPFGPRRNPANSSTRRATPRVPWRAGTTPGRNATRRAASNGCAPGEAAPRAGCACRPIRRHAPSGQGRRPPPAKKTRARRPRAIRPKGTASEASRRRARHQRRIRPKRTAGEENRKGEGPLGPLRPERPRTTGAARTRGIRRRFVRNAQPTGGGAGPRRLRGICPKRAKGAP